MALCLVDEAVMPLREKGRDVFRRPDVREARRLGRHIRRQPHTAGTYPAWAGTPRWINWKRCSRKTQVEIAT